MTFRNVLILFCLLTCAFQAILAAEADQLTIVQDDSRCGSFMKFSTIVNNLSLTVLYQMLHAPPFSIMLLLAIGSFGSVIFASVEAIRHWPFRWHSKSVLEYIICVQLAITACLIRMIGYATIVVFLILLFRMWMMDARDPRATELRKVCSEMVSSIQLNANFVYFVSFLSLISYFHHHFSSRHMKKLHDRIYRRASILP